MPQLMLAARVIVVTVATSLSVLPGCVTHDYVGQNFTPTDHVQVFYDGQVPAGYVVIGQDRAETTEYMTTESVVQAMTKKAMSVGADALCITGVDTVAVGSTTSTYGQDKGKTEYYATTDGQLHTRHVSSGKWTSNSYETVQRDKIVTAKFLKRQ